MIYDYIVVGAGVSGLILLDEIMKSSLKDKKILIIDKNLERTEFDFLSFWSKDESIYPDLIKEKWSKIGVFSSNQHKIHNLIDYRYLTIETYVLKTKIIERAKNKPNITFKEEYVKDVIDKQRFVEVITGQKIYSGKVVFDSRFKSSSLDEIKNVNVLKQRSLGMQIKTKSNCFNPSIIKLFDFTLTKDHSLNFFYLLPFKPNFALVEYVSFSTDLLEINFHRALDRYITQILRVEYETISTESCMLPLTDYDFIRKPSSNVVNIGIRGGMIKPTSGYAFTRIINDSKNIVNLLQQTQAGDYFKTLTESNLKTTRFKYKFLDNVMLDFLSNHPDKANDVFRRLLINSKIENIFKFLDENSSSIQTANLVLNLPIIKFAGIGLKKFRKVKRGV